MIYIYNTYINLFRCTFCTQRRNAATKCPVIIEAELLFLLYRFVYIFFFFFCSYFFFHHKMNELLSYARAPRIYDLLNTVDIWTFLYARRHFIEIHFWKALSYSNSSRRRHLPPTPISSILRIEFLTLKYLTYILHVLYGQRLCCAD